MQLFTHQKTIGKNLKNFILRKGYTKSSFSRLVEISISTLDQIIDGINTNPQLYHEQIKKITKTLNLPYDYFLTTLTQNLEKWQISRQQEIATFPERSKLTQELLEDLDELLIVAAYYIK